MSVVFGLSHERVAVRVAKCAQNRRHGTARAGTSSVPRHEVCLSVPKVMISFSKIVNLLW